MSVLTRSHATAEFKSLSSKDSETGMLGHTCKTLATMYFTMIEGPRLQQVSPLPIERMERIGICVIAFLHFALIYCIFLLYWCFFAFLLVFMRTHFTLEVSSHQGGKTQLRPYWQ
jgi:hypothetical protein